MRLILAAFATVTVACRAAPGPMLVSVEPGVVFDDRSVPLVLRGAFQAPVKANLDDPGDSTFDAYEVELSTGDQVATSLPATFLDQRTLSALLPAGMPRGTYRLRVVDPWGRDDTLEGALVVVPRTDPNHLPPLAHFSAAPTLGDVNTLFQFDASGSTDTETPLDLLEVSWGFQDVEGRVGWTPWTLEKGRTSPLLAGEQSVLLRVRDEDGDVGYAARTIFVADGIADGTSPLCVVTTAADNDDNAQDCATDLGDDGVLSLREVVRLAPDLNVQWVGFDVPGTTVISGPALNISGPIHIAWPENLTLERELVIQGTGKVHISGLVVKDKSGRIRVEKGAELELSDSELSNTDPIRVADGALNVTRTLFQNCQGTCITLNDNIGSVKVSQSSFTAGAASAIAIDIDHCLAGPEPAADLVGNVLVGFTTAMRVRANCQGTTSIVHQTFHANGIAIAYEGGMNHVLLNNVFSAHVASILGCEQAFALRRDHVLYGNTLDSCLADDPGVVWADPLFADPAAGDLRLRRGSPLIDTAPLIANGGLDVNGALPGMYFGSGPDYGGRETY